ncbi:MAG: ribosome recycling factor [Kiloniellaceae bacterium]
MAEPDLSDIIRRMDGAQEALRREFAGLRTGRASAGLLEPITVEAYGSSMPLNQVATIGVPEPRMVTVQVWDRTLVGTVEKAIRSSGLGLNPATEGQLIRVPIPPLSEERRVELTKIAAKYAEQGRVAVRNVRRDGMEMLKRMEREGEISKDEHHHWAEKIQKLTDEHIKALDEALAQKEEEILQV